jgi:hypothetical protein
VIPAGCSFSLHYSNYDKIQVVSRLKKVVWRQTWFFFLFSCYSAIRSFVFISLKKWRKEKMFSKKRILSVFLSIGLLLGLSPAYISEAVQAETLNANPDGKTLDTVNKEDTMQFNYGTVVNNYGSINFNYGTIINNYGEVGTNIDYITYSWGGTIGNRNKTQTIEYCEVDVVGAEANAVDGLIAHNNKTYLLKEIEKTILSISPNQTMKLSPFYSNAKLEYNGIIDSKNTYIINTLNTRSDEEPITLTISAAPVVITTASLADGNVGNLYSQALAATGDAPITWSIVSGSLPAGLTLNEATGAISGTPTATGKSTFTIKAANQAGLSSIELSITINGEQFAVSKADAANGNFTLKADDAEVTKAAANTSVAIIPSPAEGYALDKITVTKTDDPTAIVSVVNSAFTMPAYPVTVAVSFKAIPTYGVKITAGSHMTRDTDNGAEVQTVSVTDPLTKIADAVYTADEGYWFPEDYAVTSVNGISAVRLSASQIKVTGAPSADAAIVLKDAVKKTVTNAPTVTEPSSKDAFSAPDTAVKEKSPSPSAYSWTRKIMIKASQLFK